MIAGGPRAVVLLECRLASRLRTRPRDRMVHTSMKQFVNYLLCACLCAQGAFSADSGPLRGYSSEAARAERDWEAKFRAVPDVANLRSYMERLSKRPHHVG